MNPEKLYTFDAQITLKMPSALKRRVDGLYEKTGIQPAELFRRLAGAAADFYERHGWFSFPVSVTPEKPKGGTLGHLVEEHNREAARLTGRTITPGIKDKLKRAPAGLRGKQRGLGDAV